MKGKDENSKKREIRAETEAARKEVPKGNLTKTSFSVHPGSRVKARQKTLRTGKGDTINVVYRKEMKGSGAKSVGGGRVRPICSSEQTSQSE